MNGEKDRHKDSKQRGGGRMEGGRGEGGRDKKTAKAETCFIEVI